MTYGTLAIDTLNTSTGVLATQNGMTGIAKAWLVYNQTGTPSITNSFNVSSVTSNSAGNFTVNFTTAMSNANYAVTGGYEGATGANVVTIYSSAGLGTAPSNKTTTACQVQCQGSNPYSASVIFIGN
jgi:hypothetical protein